MSRWQVIRRAFKDLVKRPFYSVYERRLSRQVSGWNLPRHIGIIMDGNRRYARAAGHADVSKGHERGAETLQKVLSWCYEIGIPVLTVWSMSIENFERDSAEVQALFDLFEERARTLVEHTDVHRNRVRVRYIGKLEMLPVSLREAIREVEEATREYEKFQLNIAMAYGGRDEIVQAFRAYLREQAEAGRTTTQVAEVFNIDSIEPFLYTSGLPEPDLILRTSGEVRLSGFLLWQSAYSEFYFSDTYWPAFRRIDLLRAVRSYHLRQRRLGR